MRKPTGHKDKYSVKSEISRRYDDDGTAARTRPLSYDEIMLGRKKKKESGNVEDQRVFSELAVSGRVESDRHKGADGGGGSEPRDSRDTKRVSSLAKVDKSKVREDKSVEMEYKESSNAHIRSKIVSDDTKDRPKERSVHEKRKNQDKSTHEVDHEDTKRVISRAKEDKSKVREDKIVETEYKESSNAHIRSKIVSDDTKDRPKERSVHEKRKNQDRSADEVDHEHVKRHAKDTVVIDKYRNVNRDREKSEHVSKRTRNGYDERSRDHESRKRHDSDASERKEKKSTSESHREDLKSRSKRSRSREPEKDKGRRSISPSTRGHKQSYDAREHEELSSHHSKDRKMSNNGSGNKSKRHDTSASRLGGYSPRKRRSEAAVKTPSPISHSPKKKNAGWDSSPVKMESSLPSLNKTELSNRNEVSATVALTPSMATFGVLSSIPAMMNASVDSVQLTQATRPKRRIYVENLPSSASEEAVMKWLSGYLRPYGVNHAQTMSPCISCIVNKEKGQAVVEFLTPEDASTALSLDGKSFSGNILNIRRPKDYVETTTGVVSEKPLAGAVSVENIVEDSPNKIFVGGISKVITSEMLMEIASAFGPLKAYHFEANADLDNPCAFLEYADQSVTVKARVGLNGMKLGGKVLTVTQATPDASLVENHGDQPFYGIPMHAQPILEKPTRVLKLNNVVDPHGLSSLSELEFEELLEDIRLECSRFGIVKSINIIKHNNMPTTSETTNISQEANFMVDEVTEPSSSDTEQHEEVEEPTYVNKCHDDKQDISAPPIDSTNRPEKVNGISGNKHENEMAKDVTYDTTMVDSVPENQNLENQNQIISGIDELKLNDSKPTEDIETVDELSKPVADDTMKDDSHELNGTFEAGCVLVEYKRTEASSMAAHCLHGRVFDGRLVSVEYVANDVYCTRFKK